MLFAEVMGKVKDLPIYDPTAPTDFYTDGSCLDNGRPWACAGWGVGVENSDQLGEFFGAVPGTAQTITVQNLWLWKRPCSWRGIRSTPTVESLLIVTLRAWPSATTKRSGPGARPWECTGGWLDGNIMDGERLRASGCDMQIMEAHPEVVETL